jgi:hypothetical protein
MAVPVSRRGAGCVACARAGAARILIAQLAPAPLSRPPTRPCAALHGVGGDGVPARHEALVQRVQLRHRVRRQRPRVHVQIGRLRRVARQNRTRTHTIMNTGRMRIVLAMAIELQAAHLSLGVGGLRQWDKSALHAPAAVGRTYREQPVCVKVQGEEAWGREYRDCADVRTGLRQRLCKRCCGAQASRKRTPSTRTRTQLIPSPPHEDTPNHRRVRTCVHAQRRLLTARRPARATRPGAARGTVQGSERLGRRPFQSCTRAVGTVIEYMRMMMTSCLLQRAAAHLRNGRHRGVTQLLALGQRRVGLPGWKGICTRVCVWVGVRWSSLTECPLNARLETGVDLSFFHSLWVGVGVSVCACACQSGTGAGDVRARRGPRLHGQAFFPAERHQLPALEEGRDLDLRCTGGSREEDMGRDESVKGVTSIWR